jgi:hypothetical protein
MVFIINIILLIITIFPLLGIYFVNKISEKDDESIRLIGMIFSLTVFFLSSWASLLFVFNEIPPLTIFEICNFNIKCEVSSLSLLNLTFYTLLIDGYLCYVCGFDDEDLQESLTFIFCLEFIFIFLVLFFFHS